MGDTKPELMENRQSAQGDDGLLVYDADFLKQEEIIKRYRALIACRHDMERAKACIDQMFMNTDTSLIDGVLINTAIQLLVRCFSNPAGKGRAHLDSTRVFRKHAKVLKGKDYSSTFAQFCNARNHVITHDQEEFQSALIGIAVNPKTKSAERIKGILVKTHYLNEQNRTNLLQLIEIAYDYVSLQIKEIENGLIDYYNNMPDKPELPLLEVGDYERWNVW